MVATPKFELTTKYLRIPYLIKIYQFRAAENYTHDRRRTTHNTKILFSPKTIFPSKNTHRFLHQLNIC